MKVLRKLISSSSQMITRLFRLYSQRICRLVLSSKGPKENCRAGAAMQELDQSGNKDITRDKKKEEKNAVPDETGARGAELHTCCWARMTNETLMLVQTGVPDLVQ